MLKVYFEFDFDRSSFLQVSMVVEMAHAVNQSPQLPQSSKASQLN